MIDAFPSLLAQAESISLRFTRLGSLTEWWQWFCLGAICLSIALYAIWMYRRESMEISRPLAVALAILRLSAFAGILFFYFKLERRFERQLVKNSRVVLLVDTSQSMGLRDLDASGKEGSARIEPVVEALQSGKWLEQLRRQHDVVVYRFDDTEKPVELALFPKVSAESTTSDQRELQSLQIALRDARWLGRIFIGLFVLSLTCGMCYLWIMRSQLAPTYAWVFVVGIVSFIASFVVLGTASLRDPRLSLGMIFQGKEIDATELTKPLPSSDTNSIVVEPPIWSEQLAPRGMETRLGDALRTLLAQEQGGTAAGIVVVTDGNRNAGLDIASVTSLAQNAAIPIFPIGMGSDKLPVNVRIVDLEAPQRAYAGDKFQINAHLQLTGLPNATVQLQLISLPVQGADKQAVGAVEAEQTLALTDGEIITTKFEIESDTDHAGLREYRLRAKPLERETQRQDNERGGKVEIVDRKEKILLLASGPTREFIFLRNQLYRDEEHSSHVTVWLQSAKEGIAQEAHEILTEFPKTAEALFQYDCIVAFDPDWEALDELQVELLERYVAENAGGLIMVAGSVHMNDWVTRREHGKYRVLKQLYPVVFYSLESQALNPRSDKQQSWPLEFTREGMEAPFLWLGDDAATSRKNWEASSGIYGYYAVKDPKPGATVYARFADPDTKIDDQFPIYMASQFYGAGRVFYLGSGEMWRMRARDESLFEEFYTKLIRWTTEARMLRNSSRGLLLVDKDRCFLGERVTVRASLTDEQRRPLTVPEVNATLIRPDKQRIPIVLKKIKEGDREGNYTEQFVATLEGDYRLDLLPPQSDELLTRDVRVRLPDSELRDAKRNDAVLSELASKSGGTYYIGLASVLAESSGNSTLFDKLVPNDQTSLLPSTPDKKFEERLMAWLIGMISGVLCLEWLIRRWHKLA